MTSWIWMKGIQVAISDPIPPVNEKDKRPAVQDLLKEHRPTIDHVKSELQQDPLYSSTKHDDLWILRFVLSHKKAKKASKAAQSTLLFRQEHQLDEKDIRYAPVGSDAFACEPLKRYLAYAEPDFLQLAVPQGHPHPQQQQHSPLLLGVVVFLNYPHFDQHQLSKNVSEDDWLPAFLYINEWSFQWCDYITRTTGRLTKFVRIVDVEELKLSSLSSELTKRDGKAMAIMEDCYPQAMQGIFVCNPPTWAAFVWKVLKLVMPKRVQEKIDFISPLKSEKERQRLLPYIAEENLPVRFGGAYQPWPVEYPLPK